MRIAFRLLVALMVAATSASCGSGTIAPTVVHDYTTGSPDHRVAPQSLCVKRQTGWYCGSGSSGGPPIYYGSQGPCGDGYLYFSDGCEDVGTNVALYAGWQNWLNWPLSENLAVIKFNDNHFWKQHLACAVAPSTNSDVDGAITHDFNVNHFRKPGDPAVGQSAVFVFTFYGADGTQYPITYHIFHYGDLPAGVVTFDVYIVGTAYVARYANCPI